jgi:hypothetical protein
VSAPGGSYNESEAQEILRRAAGMQSSGFMSRDELVRAASELGITPEAIELAEEQYRIDRADEELRERYRAKRRGEFLDSFKGLAVCGGIFWYLMRDGAHNSLQRNLFAAVILAYGVWNLLKNGYLSFAENSYGWKKGFEEYKVSDKKKKALAASRTNDKVIADILQGTSASKKLEVIKNLREQSGLPLNEAKTAVDDYYKRHPEVQQQRT